MAFMIQERYEQLEREAESFFTKESPLQRRETRAFQQAALRSLTRD